MKWEEDRKQRGQRHHDLEPSEISLWTEERGGLENQWKMGMKR